MEDVSMDESAPVSTATASRKRTMAPEDNLPLHNYCPDNWSWNKRDKSFEVRLLGPNMKTAHFHPNWSNGTAGVRGTRVLNKGRYYWEINVTQRIFGTAMMFGVGTKKARLHIDAFVSMLGEDEHGWGLSHKGFLWHNGKEVRYTKPFRENEATTVGLLFDGIKGTLAYYKDGTSLGVAFTDLHLVKEELYPIVCSTAAKTEMSLGVMKREFCNLQDRCRSMILSIVKREEDIRKLCLPNPIKEYLVEACDEEKPEETPPKEPKRKHYFMRSRSCGPQGINSVKNCLVV